MRKTLAQLKRDANTGKLSAELVYRFGEDIPERLRGVRPITGSNSVAIFFRNANGQESECRIRRSALCEYDGETIKIFGYGKRPLNETEKQAFSAWEREEEAYKERNPNWIYGNGLYWKKKDYFCKRGIDYLLGFEFVNGKKYDFNTGEVFDMDIRGALELEYKIISA